MNCKAIKKLLVAYLDGELTPAKRSLIERHISGCKQCREELEALKSVQTELRQALSMEADEVSPPPELWEKLQRRLEDSPRTSFWQKYSGWLNRPLWRAVVPVALVVMIIGTLWGTGVLPGFGGMSSPPPVPAPTVAAPTIVPPKTTTPPQKLLKVTAVTDKASYLPGEQVEITVSFTNVTQGPVILDNFPPDTKIARDVTVRIFNHGNQQVQLEPGESTTYSVVWDQIGYEYGGEHVSGGTIFWDQLGSEGKQVNPSVYRIGAYVYITKDSARTLQGFHELPTVTIEFPQGSMNKTIEVNQSRTADGITMTLERVELSVDRMKIYIFKTPGYTPSRPGQREPESLAGRAVIQGTYRIDNGDALALGSFGYRPVDDRGVEYLWESLYPVPADAHSLSVRITRFSTTTGGVIADNDGPWEFQAPLQ